MAVCKVCNTQNPEGVSFCNNCGNRIDTDTATTDTTTTDTVSPDEAPAPEPVPPAQLYPEYKVPKKLIIVMSFIIIVLIEVIRRIFYSISIRQIFRRFDMEEAYVERSNLTAIYNSAEGLCNILIILTVALLGIYLYNKGCKKNGQLCNTVSYTLIPVFMCGVVVSSIAIDFLSIIINPLSFVVENIGNYNLYDVMNVVFPIVIIIVNLAVMIIFNLHVFNKLAEHSKAIRKVPSAGLYATPEKMFIKYIIFAIIGSGLVQFVMTGIRDAIPIVYNLMDLSNSDGNDSIIMFFSKAIDCLFDALVSVTYILIIIIVYKGIKAYNKSCEDSMTPGLCISVWAAVIPAGCYSIVLRVLKPIFNIVVTTVIAQFNYSLTTLPLTYALIYSYVGDIAVFAVTILVCKTLISKLQDIANKKRTA